MYHELFVQSEADYRRQRLMKEAAEDRLARSVTGAAPRWRSLVTGFRAAPATARTAGCAG